jgi:SAM-dependent methyltransferase
VTSAVPAEWAFLQGRSSLCTPQPVPGRALDVGCGSGRDAVYLAKRGWRVTAPGATLLMLAFKAGRRIVLPRGMDMEDIVALLGDGWDFEHSRSFVTEDAPRPICRANPTLYRLTRRLGAAAPPASQGG